MSSDPRPVSDALSAVARELGIDASVERRVQQHWEQIVGPVASAHAWPAAVRGGVLRILVDQGAWATEIRYLAPEILQRLRDAGVGEVREVVVNVRREPRNAQ